MHTPTPLRLDDLVNPLWRYALALYGRPGVAPSCLVLQRSLGVDVCLLIYALYACQERLRLSADSLAQTDHDLEAWRNQVVLPLRKIRETMKTGVKEIAFEHSDWVREQIKVTEVNAEQVALAYLNTQISRLPHDLTAADKMNSAIQETVHRVLTHFARRHHELSAALGNPEVRLASETIATEACNLQKHGPAPDAVRPRRQDVPHCPPEERKTNPQR